MVSKVMIKALKERVAALDDMPVDLELKAIQSLLTSIIEWEQYQKCKSEFNTVNDIVDRRLELSRIFIERKLKEEYGLDLDESLNETTGEAKSFFSYRHDPVTQSEEDLEQSILKACFGCGLSVDANAKKHLSFNVLKVEAIREYDSTSLLVRGVVWFGKSKSQSIKEQMMSLFQDELNMFIERLKEKENDKTQSK